MNGNDLARANDLKRQMDAISEKLNIKKWCVSGVYDSGSRPTIPVSGPTLELIVIIARTDLQRQLDELKAEFEAL